MENKINIETIRDLCKDACWQERWDYNGWKSQTEFSTNYTQKDWNQELMTKVNQVSAQIHENSEHDDTNFIIISPEILKMFNDIEYFHQDIPIESEQLIIGNKCVGSILERYQVYCDLDNTYNYIVVGLLSNGLCDPNNMGIIQIDGLSQTT